jgi:hypothetical protein
MRRICDVAASLEESVIAISGADIGDFSSITLFVTSDSKIVLSTEGYIF